VSGGVVYLGGSFDAMGGMPPTGQLRYSLAAVDATTGADTGWDTGYMLPNPFYPIRRASTVLSAGGTVYVGGVFGAVGGQARNDLASLDPLTGNATVWAPSADAEVLCLLGAGDVVYAGGSFENMGDWPQGGVAAIGDITTPTLLSLVSADAAVGRVRLAWYSAGGAVEATVYRRSSESGWARVGNIAADGSGRLEFEDTDVSEGVRYGYRLGVGSGGVSGGGERYFGEAWVEVPGAAGFALLGPRPSPASDGVVRVAFSLPNGAEARLELIDVAGRVVSRRDVGELGGGSHVVTFAPDRPLAAGLYWVRLTRAGRALVGKVAVAR
jgi:hypothetical protein